MRPLIYLIFILSGYAVARRFPNGAGCMPCKDGTPLVVTDTPITLCSPNYPKKYPKGAACHWQLSTEVSSWIKVRVEYLNIKKSYTGWKGCGKSYLAFQERARKTFSNSHAPCTKRYNRIERLCGKKRRITKIVRTHLSDFHFRSSRTQQRRRGFKIHVEKIPSDCYEELTAPAGNINVPVVPPRNRYENALYCKWIIKVNSPTDLVQLTCNKFHLHLGQNAKDNFEDCLRVRGGEGIDKYYTDRTGPVSISTCGADVMVEFYSGKKGVQTGFMCQYSVSPGTNLGDSCTNDIHCQKADENLVCVSGTCQCKENYVPVNGVCKKKALPEDPCEFTEQCEAGDPNTECIDGTCQCVPEDDYIIDDDQCLLKACLGDECTKDSQCQAWDTNSICDPLSNTCVCKDGYTEGIPALRAISKCYKKTKPGGSCEVPEQCQAVDNNTDCINDTCQCDPPEDYIVYNDTCYPVACVGCGCTLDQQCEAFDNNSVCDPTSNVCVCKDGFTEGTPALRFTTQCFMSISPGDNCTSDAQCIELDPKTECVNMTCSCIDNYVSVNNTCVITGGIGDNCTHDDQCTAENSECDGDSNTCECKDGYVEFNGTHCLEIVDHGEDCTEDIQCSTEDPKSECCDDGTCCCIDTYIYHNGTCLKVASLGDNCTFDEQCQASDNLTVCNATTNTCSCQPGAEVYDGTFRATDICVIPKDKGDNCTSTEECKITDPFMDCIDNECSCIDGYVFAQGECLEEASIDEACEADEQCTAVTSESECDNTTNTCQCKDGHIRHNTTTRAADIECLPEAAIGEDCETDEQCQAVENTTVCVNGTCGCPMGYVEESGTCYESAALNSSCIFNSQCLEETDNSVCDNGTCECDTNYVEYNGDCLPYAAAGENCTADLQCSIVNNMTLCIDGVCQCAPGYVEVATMAGGIACYEEKSINEACEVDEQCAATDNLTECIGGNCSCISGYVQIGGICYPGVGLNETCFFDEQCEAVDNASSCVANTCTCDAGYLQADEVLRATQRCYKHAALGEDCEITAQCTALTNHSECDTQCVCINGYIRFNDECLPVVPLNESCVENIQCEGMNNGSFCDPASGDTCQCVTPTYVEFSDTCLLVADIGEPCTENIQCETSNPETECDTVCSCFTGYVDFEGTCYPERILGESCNVSAQCMTTYSSCINETCECDEGNIEEIIGGTGFCLPIAVIGDDCFLITQCTANEMNSECKGSKCVCINGYVTYMTGCLPGKEVGETCTITAQCADHDEDSACNTTIGECQCTGDRIAVDGNCYDVEKVGMNCELDIQCSENDINSFCSGGICVCNHTAGYVEYDDICMPFSVLGDGCMFDFQCSADNAECSSGTCICKSGYYKCSVYANKCFQGVQMNSPGDQETVSTIPSGDIEMCLTGFVEGEIFLEDGVNSIKFVFDTTNVEATEQMLFSTEDLDGPTSWTASNPYLITYSDLGGNSFNMTEDGTALLSGTTTLFSLPSVWPQITVRKTNAGPPLSFMIINA